MSKCLYCFIFLLWSCSGDPGDKERNKDKEKRCSEFSLKTLWTSRLRESPLIATPLLIDIDGDSLRDIVAPTHSGEVWAIHGENGHIADNWPIYVEERSFFASPLAYDIDVDGHMDILLTTTDAEILFIRTNSTPFYGETIKIPPLRVKRDWYSLDKEYIERLAVEMSKQAGNRFHYNPNPFKETSPKLERSTSSNKPYSEFESVFGHSTDPLYSRYHPNERPLGLDPNDETFVFVDPHVLATPVIADINNDGLENELILPVSYHFDRFKYGISSNLVKTGLDKNELTNFAGAGIVVVDLTTKQIVQQKLLGLSKIASDQPSYLLAQPTVIRLAKGDPLSVIIGTAAGQIHVLRGFNLTSAPGFPISTDSITSQVAVEDVTGDGTMDLVVGDNSGNIMCIDRNGNRIWEYNIQSSVDTSVRFTNVVGTDKSMEVVVVSKHGKIWILNGTTGQPALSSPFDINSLVFSSPLLIHLPTSSNEYRLAIVVPTVTGIYVVDIKSGCVSAVAKLVAHVLQSDHIDPFNPGLEILGSSLLGEVVCMSTGGTNLTDYEWSVETWTGDAFEGNGFTHKESSFFVVCGRALSTRDAMGKSFHFSFEIHDKRANTHTPHVYNIRLSVGNKYILFNDSFSVKSPKEVFELQAMTPPIPIQAMMVLKVCNVHWQCESVSFNVRFNLVFQESLCWCLALPFLALVAAYLWLLRNESSVSVLPTVYEPQKRL